MSDIYLLYDKQRYGPFTREHVVERWREAQLPASAMYAEGEAGEWRSILHLVNPGTPTPPPLAELARKPRRKLPVGNPFEERRPWLISLLAYLHFFGIFLGLLILPHVDPEIYEQLGFGDNYVVITVTLSAVNAVTWLGIFWMRRWGVYLYVLTNGLVLLYYYLDGIVIAPSAVGAMLILAVLGCYFDRMR